IASCAGDAKGLVWRISSRRVFLFRLCATVQIDDTSINVDSRNLSSQRHRDTEKTFNGFFSVSLWWVCAFGERLAEALPFQVVRWNSSVDAAGCCAYDCRT